MKLWFWPLVLGLTSAVGLLAGLLGDGLADYLSWLALAAPVVVSGRFLMR